jgi:hypothetical protein
MPARNAGNEDGERRPAVMPARDAGERKPFLVF